MRRVPLAVFVLSAAWASALFVLGGFDLDVLGVRVRSNDPFRPLLICAIALAVHLAVGREARHRWHAVMRRVPPAGAATVLALATVAIGVAYNTTAAAGADAYGYVSQADLWIRGELRIAQPWVNEFPWPSRGWTAAPLGYKPLDQPSEAVIVPTYSPGLPLLMAATKVVAGHAAMFWVVPLCGGLLVLFTYGIGARLGSGAAGLAGAWLTVTSPPFLYTLLVPWSDVPATTAWTAAFYYLLGRTSWTAAASGFATALAILIRPNLVWGMGAVALWFLVSLSREEADGRLRVATQGLIFGATSVLGVAVTALIYQHLYGSPIESGYGRFGDNFQLSRVPANLRNYVWWLWETRAFAVLVGMLAIMFPLRWIWPHTSSRTVFVPIGLFVLGVWSMYCSYLVFDGWPFLRFLLPVYPLVMISAGAVALSACRSKEAGASLAVSGLLIIVGIFLHFQTTVKSGTFGLAKTERRYVAAGQLARKWTEDASIIFSLGHSGSARYYGGRQTLRYDLLDPEWLDRSVAWLHQRGVHPYLLLEEHELQDFQRRFDGQRALRLTHANPVFRYDGFGTVVLFDLLQENQAPTQHVQGALDRTTSVPPAPQPTLVLR